MKMPDENGVPLDFDEVVDSINDTYSPSRSIPERIRNGIGEPLLRLLDWITWQMTLGHLDLQNLIDVDRAQQREALVRMCFEFGIPVPDFATVEQVRCIAKNAPFIAKFKNNDMGLETYLQCLTDIPIEVKSSRKPPNGLVWLWGEDGRTFPSEEHIATAGTGEDHVAYFFSEQLLEQELVVTVTRVTS